MLIKETPIVFVMQTKNWIVFLIKFGATQYRCLLEKPVGVWNELSRVFVRQVLPRFGNYFAMVWRTKAQNRAKASFHQVKLKFGPRSCLAWIALAQLQVPLSAKEFLLSGRLRFQSCLSIYELTRFDFRVLAFRGNLTIIKRYFPLPHKKDPHQGVKDTLFLDRGQISTKLAPLTSEREIWLVWHW